MMRRRMSLGASRLMWSLWIAMWGFSLFIVARYSIQGLNAYRWPAAQGTITACRGVKNRVGNADDKPDWVYGVRVVYRYTVNGVAHTAERIRFDDKDTGDRARALRTLNRYTAGRAVSVRYCPEDPTLATLEPGIRRGTAILITVQCVAVLFGVLGYLWGWRWYSRGSR